MWPGSPNVTLRRKNFNRPLCVHSCTSPQPAHVVNTQNTNTMAADQQEWRTAFDMAAAALAVKTRVTDLLIDECVALRRALDAATATDTASDAAAGDGDPLQDDQRLQDSVAEEVAAATAAAHERDAARLEVAELKLQLRAQAQAAEAAATAAAREFETARLEVARLQHELHDASEAAKELIDVVHQHLDGNDDTGGGSPQSLSGSCLCSDGAPGNPLFGDEQAEQWSSPPSDFAHHCSGDASTPPTTGRSFGGFSSPSPSVATTPVTMRATPGGVSAGRGGHVAGIFTPLEHRLTGMAHRLQALLHASNGSLQPYGKIAAELAAAPPSAGKAPPAAALQDSSPAKDTARGARPLEGHLMMRSLTTGDGAIEVAATR